MIGDGRRWDEDETRESGQSTQLPRSHHGRGSGGEAWSAQVCVSWHQDAASSWISLTRPTARVCGVRHGPSSRSRTRPPGHWVCTTKKMHSGERLISLARVAGAPKGRHVSARPRRPWHANEIRCVSGALGRKAAGLRPAGGKVRWMVSLNGDIGGRRRQDKTGERGKERLRGRTPHRAPAPAPLQQ